MKHRYRLYEVYSDGKRHDTGRYITCIKPAIDYRGRIVNGCSAIEEVFALYHFSKYQHCFTYCELLDGFEIKYHFSDKEGPLPVWALITEGDNIA